MQFLGFGPPRSTNLPTYLPTYPPTTTPPVGVVGWAGHVSQPDSTPFFFEDKVVRGMVDPSAGPPVCEDVYMRGMGWAPAGGPEGPRISGALRARILAYLTVPKNFRSRFAREAFARTAERLAPRPEPPYARTFECEEWVAF